MKSASCKMPGELFIGANTFVCANEFGTASTRQVQPSKPLIPSLFGNPLPQLANHYDAVYPLRVKKSRHPRRLCCRVRE